MNKKRQLLWNKIIELSTQMQSLALPNQSLADLSVDEAHASQPWKAISALEKERGLLLTDFFSKKVLPDEISEVHDCITQLQKIDSHLYSISQNIKNEITDKFKKVAAVNRAVSAYTENQNDKI